MFKKIAIVIMGFLITFVFFISLVRLKNGLNPTFSLNTLSNVLKTYDNPHLVEHLLTTNYWDVRNMVDELDTSYGGGGGGARSRGDINDITKDTKFWNDIKSGLDWSDFITLPFAVLYDVGYNVYFIISAINSLCSIA